MRVSNIKQMYNSLFNKLHPYTKSINNAYDFFHDTVIQFAFLFIVPYLLIQYKYIDNLNYDLPTLLGFPKPANDSMYGILILLGEMTILLTYILFAIILAMAYIADVYRAEVNPYPRHFEKSIESTLDVLFVVFPTIIIVYLLIPSLGFIFNNDLEMETVFNLNIVGHQWYWSYEYDIPFAIDLYDLISDNTVVFNKIEFDSLIDQETTYNRLLQVDKRVIIPVNTLIHATVTSQDVIHSWAVPQLGIKIDAIPGRLMTFILQSNLLGVFYGQCSELCGVNHAFMPICVQSVELDVFIDWFLCVLGFNPSSYILNSMVSLPAELPEY